MMILPFTGIFNYGSTDSKVHGRTIVLYCSRNTIEWRDEKQQPGRGRSKRYIMMYRLGRSVGSKSDHD